MVLMGALILVWLSESEKRAEIQAARSTMSEWFGYKESVEVISPESKQEIPSATKVAKAVRVLLEEEGVKNGEERQFLLQKAKKETPPEHIEKEYSRKYEDLLRAPIPVGEIVAERIETDGRVYRQETTDDRVKVRQVISPAGELESVDIRHPDGRHSFRSFRDGNPRQLKHKDAQGNSSSFFFRPNGELKSAKYMNGASDYVLVHYDEYGLERDRWVHYRKD